MGGGGTPAGLKDGQVQKGRNESVHLGLEEEYEQVPKPAGGCGGPQPTAS